MECFYGFMTCWVLFAAMNLMADDKGWLKDRWYVWFTTLPLRIPILLVGVMCAYIYSLFRFTFKPLTREIYAGLADISDVYSIGNNFKFCILKDSKRSTAKYYFVRIEDAEEMEESDD